MSGSSTTGAKGVYGTLGVASSSNVPGARSGSVGWTDSSGNLWLFGGWGFATNSAVGSTGDLNDLWEFTPSTQEWTWVSGSNTTRSTGLYGTKGVASTSNTPGARDSAVSWKDGSGNFWLFGGSGYNDLWEYSPTPKTWTWVSGSNTAGSAGVYGTQGVASASNTPGARGSSSEGSAYGWTDSSGNLWLFGGDGFDDIWEFSTLTKEWTWIGGSTTTGAAPIYGTQGVASTSNTPGGRELAVSWTDSSGNLWLYGGEVPSVSCANDFSDLWEFSVSTKEWTWVSGAQCESVVPVYGTQGTASATNTPGARDSAVGWTDSGGNLWLFGGFDYTGSGTSGTNEYLNDLWKFSTTTKEWTWEGGSNTGGANGVYGTLGTPSASNVPGARGSEGVPLALTDSSGNFWLFGGDGYGASGTSDGLLNDLWRYEP